MSFKDVSYLEPWWPFVQPSGTICANLVEGIMRTILRNYFEFRPVVQEMSFKDISYLELWRPFCSVEQNQLCNFNRGYQEEQFCEIILKLDQWFRRCHLKDLLSGALAASVTICAILKKDIMSNIHVKLYEIGTSGLGDVV